MKIIFIFLFALFSITKSANVHEIAFNTQYTVDIRKYPNGYIPSETVTYFKVAVEENQKIEFQLKTIRGKTPQLFKVFTCSYDKEPTEAEILSKKEGCSDALPYTISKDGLLDKFTYDIETGENVKYLSILVYNEYDCDYLTIYVYSEKRGIGFTFYDINYMKELELKNDILEKHEGVFVFRLENDNRNINSIKFKTKKKITSETIVKVAGFRDKPNNPDDLDNFTFGIDPKLKSVTNDEEYYIYEFEFDYEKIDDIGYLCCFLLINEKVDYLSILVGNN